ncbi:MAG: hypothetical protein KME64_15475 [Scytonematopsis contorta HA4267-MV1]|jgi:hypothetical protein|nr:hypothetical protein [Scytonematopsis contorta HA4267-MV1]
MSRVFAVTLLFSTAILNILTILPAKAVENPQLLNDFINSPAYNGLFSDTYPNFFREGRVLLEREIEILQEEPTPDETLLEINPKVRETQEQLEQNQPPVENK